MEISIPSEVAKGLPSPDGQGLVRVSVALKIGEDGKASVVEINDTPVGEDDGKQSMEEAAEGMPSPGDIATQILGQ